MERLLKRGLIFFGLILILSIGFVSALGGSGTSLHPYKIKTCKDLQLVQDHLTSNFILEDNITDCNIIPIGRGESNLDPLIDPPFSGSFDGNGKVISNLNIVVEGTGNSPSTLCVNFHTGLFGHNTGTIKNLGLDGVTIDVRTLCEDNWPNAWGAIGSLVGVNEGIISSCFAKNVNILGGRPVGGLVGMSSGENSIIENCFVGGSVTGNIDIGGLVGGNGGNIKNSYSTCTLNDNINSFNEFMDGHGGFIGYNYEGLIENSFSTGSLSIIKDGSGSMPIGGFVGKSDYTRYYNYTSTTDVYGIFNNIYWYNQPGDSADLCYGGSKVVSCVSQNLDYFKDSVKTKAPFSSWDFIDTWAEVSGDYPILKWEITGVVTTSSKSGIVNGKTTDIITKGFDNKINLSIDKSTNISKTFSDIKDIEIMDGNKKIIEFLNNFSVSSLSLNFSINITKAGKGGIIVNGLELQPGSTKTVYIDRILGTEYICIKDSYSSDFPSATCDQFGEIRMVCPGTFNQYTCSLTDNNAQIKVKGLSHSSVVETEYNPPQDETETNNNGGGGSSGGGGGSSGNRITSNSIIKICEELWECTQWTPSICSSEKVQLRNCSDINKCGTSKNIPEQTRICNYNSDSSENDGRLNIISNIDNSLNDIYSVQFVDNLLYGMLIFSFIISIMIVILAIKKVYLKKRLKR